MVLPDVNVLVYAHREDLAGHGRYRDWLTDIVNCDAFYGMSDHVLSGFLRVVTHPRVFWKPTPLKVAVAFVTEIRDRVNCVPISPGPRHSEIFIRLCKIAGARGNLVPDAYLAAFAIEAGAEWVTTDRGLREISGSPLAASTRLAPLPFLVML